MEQSRWNPAAKIRDYRRLMKMARRPTREEFIQVSKVSAIGILLIGAIGFAVFLVMQLVNAIL